jgi:anti-anti-sigma regulatory factor
VLEVEIVTGNVTVVCRTNGSLNAATVTTFRGAVMLGLGEPGLIIDLSGLDFLDGAGLTAPVGAIRRAREHSPRRR